MEARTCLIRAGSGYSLWSYLPLNDENFTLLNLNIQLANLHQILCVASLGVKKGCKCFEADWIITLLSLVKFDFGPNQTTHFGVSCP